MMGSHMNFKNFVETSQLDSNGGKATSNYPLARQSSVYSLTFDELQSTLGGSGKDFGSMNMEELLKSIWTAGDSQAVASSVGGADVALQRQGSLTLPRTLSQKTVDEVWRDVLKETIGVKDGCGGGGSGFDFGPREPTLGEMTLEQFLAKAGVVKEEILPLPNGSTGLAMEFQESSQNLGVFGNQLAEHSNMVLSSPNLGMNVSSVNMIGVGTSQQEIQQPQPQLQPLFPKGTTVAFSSPTQHRTNDQMSGCVTKAPLIAMRSPLSNSAVQGGAMAMGRSPRNPLHSHPIVSSSVDTPSISPSPHNFGEGGRGRRSSGSLEKVVERRRKRMIKNRESAARSRARKQAYTLELEAEIAKLKEINQGLLEKQKEMMEMQKNETIETTNGPWGCKRVCLRRTLTGPW